MKFGNFFFEFSLGFFTEKMPAMKRSKMDDVRQNVSDGNSNNAQLTDILSGVHNTANAIAEVLEEVKSLAGKTDENTSKLKDIGNLDDIGNLIDGVGDEVKTLRTKTDEIGSRCKANSESMFHFEQTVKETIAETISEKMGGKLDERINEAVSVIVAEQLEEKKTNDSKNEFTNEEVAYIRFLLRKVGLGTNQQQSASGASSSQSSPQQGSSSSSLLPCQQAQSNGSQQCAQQWYSIFFIGFGFSSN